MSNSVSNPVNDGSISAINESYSMRDKLPNETADLKENVEENDRDMPRKYGISLLFRHLVCCSCFTAERSNSMYKSDNNDSSKSLKNDINGKKKKADNLKQTRLKALDKSKDKGQYNDVAVCSPLAQNLSASNGTNSCFRELNNDEDSQDSEGNSKSIKIFAENEKLLPEISEKNQNKKCFIIDLDETLVHSSFKYVNTADINVNVDIDGIQHEVYVCKRPYVDEFLAELGGLFECVLFTASLGKYADPVTNFLDPNGIFEARLFREACALKEGNYVKDLDAIGRDIENIIILDNSPVSYLLHPKNALQIVSWFDDPTDTALKDLIPYFKDLAASPLSVSEWLERNRPPETAGILGHPPSNLHWILMQTLSVPEAVAIYQQRLRESYHASGSSNVSRQSSTKASGDNHESHPHHGLITQVIKANRRKSMAAQEDESNRPPVSSPVARPSSGICLDDDDDDIDYLMESYTDHEGNCEGSEAKFIYHSIDQKSDN